MSLVLCPHLSNEEPGESCLKVSVAVARILAKSQQGSDE